MSEDDETYCRLCAEPTPKIQMISIEDDVAINSKISTKMLWINIDVSSSNELPSTICFSCFDMLEKTWMFLHNVRTAQNKLNTIFSNKQSNVNNASSSEKRHNVANNAGKPVNTNWEEFQETKEEVKTEDSLEDVDTVNPQTLLDVEYEIVKIERESECSYGRDGSSTSDSDLPLHHSVKKKRAKNKSKRKKSFDNEILEEDLPNLNEAISLDVSYNMTWDDYMCRCAHCDAQCKNVESLRLHSLQIHTCCCLFKCSDCGKVIANYKTFVNHVRLHKKLLRYCCEYCNKRFTMTSYMKKHRNTAHRNAHNTICQNCGSSFESPELLEDHLQIYSKPFKKQTRKCEKVNIELKCNHCCKVFKSRSNLQQHKLLHSERSRDFSCHVCGKMFFTKGTLSTHMSIHEDTKPFKCEFCPMAFRARGNLQSHISLHSNVKPFVCEQCGKSFRVKRHLKSHSIVHTDFMPYVCQYCNKPFRFKTRLNLHLRQHTGVKPYKCEFCRRDFTNGSNFKKHMKRRHNIDTSKRKYNNVEDQNIKDKDEINIDNQ